MTEYSFTHLEYLSNCNIWQIMNPTNALATFSQNTRMQNILKPSILCHVGTHWIVLSEYSQMSIHMPGFWSFSRFLHPLVLVKLTTSSIRVKNNWACNFKNTLLVRISHFPDCRLQTASLFADIQACHTLEFPGVETQRKSWLGSQLGKGIGVWFIVLYPPKCPHALPSLSVSMCM